MFVSAWRPYSLGRARTPFLITVVENPSVLCSHLFGPFAGGPVWAPRGPVSTLPESLPTHCLTKNKTGRRKGRLPCEHDCKWGEKIVTIKSVSIFRVRQKDFFFFSFIGCGKERGNGMIRWPNGMVVQRTFCPVLRRGCLLP